MKEGRESKPFGVLSFRCPPPWRLTLVVHINRQQPASVSACNNCSRVYLWCLRTRKRFFFSPQHHVGESLSLSAPLSSYAPCRHFFSSFSSFSHPSTFSALLSSLLKTHLHFYCTHLLAHSYPSNTHSHPFLLLHSYSFTTSPHHTRTHIHTRTLSRFFFWSPLLSQPQPYTFATPQQLPHPHP